MGRGVAKTILMLGCLSAMGLGPLYAQVYTDTLADLTNPGGAYNSLVIGDKTFTDFAYQATGLTSFDPSQIQVTASIGADGVYYLSWSGSVALATLSTAVADLKLDYAVMATGGIIDMIDQSYTGSAQPAGSTFLAVDETASIGSFGGQVVGQSHLTAYDVTDPPAETSSNSSRLDRDCSEETITSGCQTVPVIWRPAAESRIAAIQAFAAATRLLIAIEN